MIMVILYCVYGIVAVMFGVGWWRLRQVLRASTSPASLRQNEKNDLPSVTVCIPARNESHAMTDSLQRVLASTYPKLEIIVMDDVSGDKTPALIKAFASEGVRFIEGKTVPAGWLGKNHALNTLMQQASGAYVLFLDVDTHVAPTSIERMVTYIMMENSAMISVLPRREDGLRASTIFAPLRYLWELLFHRRSAPAVASNAWMIDRQQFLDDFRDFEKLRGIIQPEAHIAATYAALERYRFLISSPQLGVAYEKKWRSQLETSIRLLFPLLGARISHALVAVVDLLIVLTSVVMLIIAIAMSWWLHIVLAGVLYVAGSVFYGSYLSVVWRRGWILGAILWPVIVLQEVILIITSTLQYKRGTVTWKGRPVRLPPKTTHRSTEV